MIKRIYGALPPGYPSENVIAGRINAYYRAYGTGYDFCTFYDGDNMLALYYGGELYVHCNENGDLQSKSPFPIIKFKKLDNSVDFHEVCRFT